MSSAPHTCLVVPCYNEAERLDTDAFVAALRDDPRLCIVFVNDGSTDATLQVLQALAARDPARLRVVNQQPNQGKAAAVRLGMQHALDLAEHYAGYWDADLATPLDEVARFIAVLDRSPQLLVVFGARVQLLGRSIVRGSLRHYLGRIFATAASQVLQLPVYDTQCGAKLFRVDDDTRALFRDPFVVNWTFDVELIARLIRLRREGGGAPAQQAIYELPLNRWQDVAGSKVRPRDFVTALLEMVRIRARYFGSAASGGQHPMAQIANPTAVPDLLKSPPRAATESTPVHREDPR